MIGEEAKTGWRGLGICGQRRADWELLLGGRLNMGQIRAGGNEWMNVADKPTRVPRMRGSVITTTSIGGRMTLHAVGVWLP
jgi:hypothetical protein